MKRRNFIKSTGMVAVGASLSHGILASDIIFKNQIRLGFIGVGARGAGTLQLALKRNDIIVTAIADIDGEAALRAAEVVKKTTGKQPVLYTKGAYDYQNLLNSSDVDAVFICTPWEWHTEMSVDALKAGKATACEVAGASSLEECWQLVRAQEETGTPFMIMENVCYRRDVMAVLNMCRLGLFGELIHFQGGYQHDLREVKFNDGKKYYGGGVEFGDKGYSEAKWRTQHSVYRNGDLYPTHGIGPIGSMINNNRGNRFLYLTSVASKSKGLHDYIINHPNGGNDHPNARIKFKLGDVITTSIVTNNEETIILSHDTNLPRPYSLGFRVQGTKGIWMDVNKSIYLEGKSPAHQWELADQYLDKYDHPLWMRFSDDASGAGHGGMDFFVMNAFIEAFKNRHDMPLDVYDHASWAAITCLSEQSIAEGGAPQHFPDFTSGKWINRKPIFALGDQY